MARIIAILSVSIGITAILAVHGWDTECEILSLRGQILDVKLSHSREKLGVWATTTADLADVPM